MDQAREQVFKKPSVLICGYGIVGKHLKETFEWADIYDKYKLYKCSNPYEGKWGS